MNIGTIRAFFMWRSILNGGLLVFTALVCAFGKQWIYRVHSKWYPIPRDAFLVVIYSSIALYRILFITLNLTPYLALSILD